jgi:nucleoid-associated protein YgaU
VNGDGGRPGDPDRNGSVLPVVGLAVAVTGLHLLGRGELAAPPVGSLTGLQGWLETRSPVGAALAVVRLAALAVGYHLLAAMALATLARRRDRVVVAAGAARAAVPALRHLVGAVAGLSLSAATTATATAAPGVPGAASDATGTEPAPAAAPTTATLTNLTVGTVTLGRLDVDRRDPAGHVTLERLDPAPTDPTDPTEQPSTATPHGPAAAGRTHVVVPGDHLWALADAELAAGAAVPPTGVAVDDYWMRVIRANPQLGDPDLLFPGEVVVLPPVPGR